MKFILKTFIKKVILYIIDNIQRLKLYTKIIKLSSSTVQYIIADSINLEKYWKWIYIKHDDIAKPEEKNRNYIIALNKHNKIVGSVMLQNNKVNEEFTYCVLFSLKVKIQYRRLGIGKKLTLKAIDMAKKSGYSELFLSTSEKNIKARNLYSSIGFKEVKYKNLSSFYKKEIDAYKNKKMVAYLLKIS